MYNRFLKNEKGFTGLEAAIVLIAFVVVAAVFSYVMLGAGFFTTQKSQEVVHTGVTQASSSLAPAGDVIVRGITGNYADQVIFYITSTAGGTPVDLNKTVITYTDNDDFASQQYTITTGGWDYYPVIDNGGARNLIETNEKYKIILDLATNGSRVNVFASNSKPSVNEKIKIEVKPPEGAVLLLTKTMPPALANGNFYPVY